MADTKISGLTALTGANTASGDLLTIVDISDTTMAATGTNKNITLTELQSAPVSAGTANGVAYLNGSKVVTTGSALVFNGTNLSVGTTALSGGKFSTIADLTAVNGVVIRDSATAYANNDNYVLLQNSTGSTAGGLTHPASQSLGIWGFDDIRFVQGSGSTEQMRLTSTGLGIGTTSPAVNLDVSSSTGTEIITRRNGGRTVNTYADGVNAILAYSTGALRIGETTSTVGANFTERARIDSSGNLLVGTTSAIGRTGISGQLAISAASGRDAGYFLQTTNSQFAITSHVNTTTGTRYHVGFGDGTTWTERGTISTNGSATSYNTSSDYRLKNITGPITNSGAYIDSLNPVEGTWKENGSVFVGLIAHEVQEVSRTSIATGEKDGEKMQSMDYSSAEIIANLIAEVKSLRARVAALES